MRPTSSIIEEKPERFSLSHDRIYLIGSVSCKWRYQLKLIHSLLGDSYGCVNHACGAIDPPSRVEYNRDVIHNSVEPNTVMLCTVASRSNIVSQTESAQFSSRPRNL